jgi:hypothetical protein
MTKMPIAWWIWLISGIILTISGASTWLYCIVNNIP